MAKKKPAYADGECDWDEYDRVVKECLKDKCPIKMWGIGHPFPLMYISRATRKAINYDRGAFVRRIDDFAYAIAMHENNHKQFVKFKERPTAVVEEEAP